MSCYKVITDRLNTFFTNNKITLGTAAPTTGTHAAGDIVLSSSANSTAFGWICTAAGTPGTWKVLKSGGDVTSVSGNAGTATKLKTARKINGTSFDGTSDITTSKWGVARTLTIGEKSQSVDGSDNITWSLSDIGVAKTEHIHDISDITDLQSHLDVLDLSVTLFDIEEGFDVDVDSNTEKFQNMIDYCIANNKNILFPAGTYVFNSLDLGEKANLTIKGCSSNFATFAQKNINTGKFTDNLTRIICNADDGETFFNHKNAVLILENIGFYNLAKDSNGDFIEQQEAKSCVMIQHTKSEDATNNVEKGKVFCFNCAFYGWKVVFGGEFTFQHLEDEWGTGKVESDYDYYKQSCVLASRCRFTRNGIGINQPVDGRIIDCSFNKNDYAIVLRENSGFTTISNCRIEWNIYNGIYCEKAHEVTVSNCEFDCNGYAGLYAVENTCSNFIDSVYRRNGAYVATADDGSHKLDYVNNVHIYAVDNVHCNFSGNNTTVKAISDVGSAAQRPSNCTNFVNNSYCIISNNILCGCTKGDKTDANQMVDNVDCIISNNMLEESQAGDNQLSTDTKVTNTLDTTTKFYLTGTTSSTTATGTQYFDTGIYATTTAGQLHTGSLEVSGNITTTGNGNHNIGSTTNRFNSIVGANVYVYDSNEKQYASLRTTTIGTTDTQGVGRIIAGNDTASGTAGNAKGQILLYGTNTGYTTVTPGNNTTSNITITLPSSGGTLARTSDDITGSAAKWTVARTLSWTGDVTGSMSIDGSADKSAALTLASSGVTAGSYGPSANASPAHSGTFSVPYITVDAKGRVTAASTKTITLPADNNTDTKVTNTLDTTTKFYLTGTTSSTTATGTQYFDTGIYATTTAGQLHVTGGLISGNTVRSDTSVTDNLGTTAIPWKGVYAKNIYSYGSDEANYGSLRAYTQGTADTVGVGRLYLGNSTVSGTVGNAKGNLIMYGSSSGYTQITPGNNTTSNYTLTLPAKTGTVACTSDLSDYLPLSGGTITGSLTVNDDIISGSVSTTGLLISNMDSGEYETFVLHDSSGWMSDEGYPGYHIGNEENSIYFCGKKISYCPFSPVSSISSIDEDGIETSCEHNEFVAYDIYHQGNPPTADEVGALSTDGGTVTGETTFESIVTADTIYSNNAINIASDRNLKDGIDYIKRDNDVTILSNNEKNISLKDMFDFVKDELGLATYTMKNDKENKKKINFIAQDLLYNNNNEDSKVGQLIVNAERAVNEDTALSYDLGNYVSIIAGALQYSIDKIEVLEAKIKELESK